MYNGEYLYPPRPEQKIPPALIPFYERNGFVAQVKRNGTCSVLIIDPDKNVQTWTRHNDSHKAWVANKTTLKPMIDAAKGWTVFVAELLHSKVEGIKDTQYIFDILMFDGKSLVGTTFTERQQLLMDLFSSSFTGETFGHYVITNNIWLAKNITSGFKELFASLTNPEDEGLVFKKANAKLEHCFKEKSNASWQVKCRRPHKNYGF